MKTTNGLGLLHQISNFVMETVEAALFMFDDYAPVANDIWTRAADRLAEQEAQQEVHESSPAATQVSADQDAAGERPDPPPSPGVEGPGTPNITLFTQLSNMSHGTPRIDVEIQCGRPRLRMWPTGTNEGPYIGIDVADWYILTSLADTAIDEAAASRQ